MNQKVIIYTRVSTEEQKVNGFSLREQEARLRKECNRENNQVIAHYQDDHSAKNFNRPAFQQMLADLKEKRVTANLFLCIRMDRFSRNLQESLKMIQVLKKLGLDFKVVEGGNFDLDTPENLIPFILNMVLPQVENERRGLNTKRGMRQAQREGRWTGTAPNGYKWYRENDKSLLTPNVKAKLVRLAFEEFAKGIFTSEEIRRKLVKKGLKCSRSQFSRLLRNPVYIGQIKIERWKDEPEEIVMGLHEPLINEELFNEVQSILEGRIKKSKVRSSRDGKLPLRGFLQCRICGGNLTGSASRSRTGARHFYYHCQKGCRERFRADEANGQFVSFLGDFKIPDEVLTLYYHVMEDVFKKDDAQRENEINTLESQINKFRERINGVEDKFIDNLIDDETYKKAKARYEQDISELLKRKAELESRDSNFLKYVNYGFSLLKDLPEYYLKANIEIKQKLISSIFAEKLVFEDKKYRTSQINEVLALLTSNINHLGIPQNKQAIKKDGLLHRASPRGIEPLLQE